MVVIKSEGKFNDNSYLVDGNLMGTKEILAIYVIESDGMRLLIDTSSPFQSRKIVRKMKELGIFPVHKILLTHSHWDHIQGVEKLKILMKETDVEVLASEKAIDNLKDPKIINDVLENEMFNVQAKPVEDVTPLKEGDVIDLNGLKLEVLNFFGHTMDSIALYDEKNKNIFVGDAIGAVLDNNPIEPPFMPPDFNEQELLKTYQKLRDMKDKLNSICLGHFGVLTENDFNKILEEIEEFYYKTRDSIIKWYNENPSLESLTSKYFETFMPSIPNPEMQMEIFKLTMDWLIKSLKFSGFIK